VWPDFWISAELLRAFIPKKGWGDQQPTMAPTVAPATNYGTSNQLCIFH